MDAAPRCRILQEAALRLAADVDPVARQIGAVNTLVRQPDGSFKGYNTDWLAAIQVTTPCTLIICISLRPGPLHSSTSHRMHAAGIVFGRYPSSNPLIWAWFPQCRACYALTATPVTLRHYTHPCLQAIERGLLGITGGVTAAAASSSSAGESPLKGKTVVVIGAGGAGRALAFGAADRWAAGWLAYNRIFPSHMQCCY